LSTSLEATPACNRNPADIRKGRSNSDQVNELAPVRFGQSRRLWQAELAVYAALLIFAGIAIFPFLLTAWYWPIALLAFALFIGWHWMRCWRRPYVSSRILYCIQNRWYLRDQGGEQEIHLCDEILLWPQIVVLPARIASGEKKYLVLTPDAMEADDWRRLRVFLNMGVVKAAS